MLCLPSRFPTALQDQAALDQLDAAVALAHHHDAVTGTAKQAVANDYALRLARSRHALEGRVAAALSTAIFRGGEDREAESTVATGGSRTVETHGDSIVDDCSEDREVTSRSAEAGDANAQQQGRHTAPSALPDPHVFDPTRASRSTAANGAARPTLHHCAAANASLCQVPLEESHDCAVMMLVVHNPIVWPRRADLQVPLSRIDCNYTVTDSVGAVLPSALLPVAPATAALQALMHATGAPAARFLSNGTRAVCHLALQVTAPPLGYTSIFLAPHAAPAHANAAALALAGGGAEALTTPAIAVTAPQAPPLAAAAAAASLLAQR